MINNGNEYLWLVAMPLNHDNDFFFYLAIQFTHNRAMFHLDAVDVFSKKLFCIEF